MYVMTPFTSLLVLENEEMYAQYKVDRGRKDHWAMYACPEKIKVVYEPDENSPPDARHPEDQKPTDQQVLQTILVRSAAALHLLAERAERTCRPGADGAALLRRSDGRAGNQARDATKRAPLQVEENGFDGDGR